MKKTCLLLSVLAINMLAQAQWQQIDGSTSGTSGLFFNYLPNGNQNLSFGYCLERQENNNSMLAGGFFNYVQYGNVNQVSANIAELNSSGWQQNVGLEYPYGNQSGMFTDFPQSILLADLEEFFIPNSTTRTKWAVGVPIAFIDLITVPLPATYTIAKHIIYFDTNTSKWVEPSGITSGYGTCMQVFEDELYVGGQFFLTNFPGLHTFIKISPNGNITPIQVIGSEIKTLEVIDINGTEKLYVGGRFTGIVTAIPAINIASLEIINSIPTWSSVGISTNVGINQGIPAAVYSIDKYQKTGTGDVLCAGTEPVNVIGVTVNTDCIPQLAALICIPGSAKSDINDVYAGGLWELNNGFGLWNNTIKTNGPVYAVEGANNKVHVGGLFSTIVDPNSIQNPTTAVNNFFSWDGLNIFNQNEGFNHVVFDLEGWNTTLYATGLFDQTVSTNGAVTVNKIAKMNLGTGTSFYTQKATAVNHNKIDAINAYPNPTTNVLSIDISSNDDSNVHIQLFDITGKLIINHDYLLNEGDNTVALSLLTLGIESGAYFLKVEQQNSLWQEKILFQK